MPSTKQIICPTCRELVEVVDHRVVAHPREDGECPATGMRYHSIGGLRVVGGPGVEILDVQDGPACRGCGAPGVFIEARIHPGAIARASRN